MRESTNEWGERFASNGPRCSTLLVDEFDALAAVELGVAEAEGLPAATEGADGAIDGYDLGLRLDSIECEGNDAVVGGTATAVVMMLRWYRERD